MHRNHFQEHILVFLIVPYDATAVPSGAANSLAAFLSHQSFPQKLDDETEPSDDEDSVTLQRQILSQIRTRSVATQKGFAGNMKRELAKKGMRASSCILIDLEPTLRKKARL